LKKHYNMRQIFAKIWKDPVGSKVIAAGIGYVLSNIYTFLQSKYQGVDFKEVIQAQALYFNLSDWWYYILLSSGFIIVSISGIWLLKKIIVRCVNKKKKFSVPPTSTEDILPIAPAHSSVLFAERIAGAFPGQRGIKWYNSKVAVKRLDKFFQKQFTFSEGSLQYISDPFWWFRGHQGEPIRTFKVLSKNKILLNNDELKIKRIAVNSDNARYYNEFIYIEAEAEEPSGATEINWQQVKKQIEFFGFAHESYGISDGTIITAEEYDDGAHIDKKGRVIPNNNAEIRCRYLSPYNLIICAKQSAYNDCNSHQFEIETPEMFNKLLSKKMSPQSFFDYLQTYPKPSW